MYITTGTGERCAVLDTSIRAGEVRYTLDEAPASLGASIKLWTADGGMCLRTDAVADYTHPRIEGRTVVLSSMAPTEPEPVPAEPEEPEEPDTEADMLETILDHEARLAALELGGED